MNDLQRRISELSEADRFHALIWLAGEYPDAVARCLGLVRPGVRIVPVIQGEVIESRYHDARVEEGGTG